jgi:hypothetical protein
MAHHRRRPAEHPIMGSVEQRSSRRARVRWQENKAKSDPRIKANHPRFNRKSELIQKPVPLLLFLSLFLSLLALLLSHQIDLRSESASNALRSIERSERTF